MLTFVVTEENEKPKGDEITKEESEYELEVYLGESVIEEQSQGDICTRDFGDKKIYRFSEGASGFVTSSLFSDIGFRVYEFQNRMMLGGALGAAGIEDNPMDHVLMEHLFSLTSDKETVLKRKQKKSTVIFSHKDKELFRYSLESISVSDADMERFLLFIRYRYGVHPEILSELEESSGIPKEFVVHRYNVGTEKISLELLSIDNSTNRPRSELTPIVIPEEEIIYELVAKVANSSEQDFSNTCTSLKQKAIENAKDGDYLDSIALFLGYTLATGEQMPQEFFEFKDAITKDGDVQLLFASISPQSKEAAERAVNDLKTLSDKSKDGVSTVLIFRANVLTSLEKRTEAIDSFLAALSKQPMIVGAWKDLGDIYYGNYDTVKAWLCWDTGRFLYRNHKLFQDVNQFEEKLQDDYPEFFMKRVEQGGAGQRR